MCNLLANSPANKSMALKFGLFDVVRTSSRVCCAANARRRACAPGPLISLSAQVLPLLHAGDAELCAVVAGIVVNLPPWQQFRSEAALLCHAAFIKIKRAPNLCVSLRKNIKLAGLFPIIESYARSKNER